MAIYFDRGSLPELSTDQKRGAESAYSRIKEKQAAGELAFTGLPNGQTDEIMALAVALRQEVGAIILIGIGGSDLGARAIHRALNHQFYNLLPERKRGPQLFFAGDTTDPVALQEIIEVADMHNVALIVISKSGNTIEQMSTFTYLRSKLIEAIGEELSLKRIVFVTDEKEGSLRQLATTYGYRTLAAPEGVGGRFAVLSSIGLLTAAITGIDIADLLKGATELKIADEQAGQESLVVQFAAFQFAAFERGQHCSVLMPYVYGLREFAFWFRQLWAESLGKNGSGPTPIAAIGPTDQHSQLQLYQEGPNDKIYTFLTVDEQPYDLILPRSFPELPAAAYLEGHTFGEIIANEACATLLALAQANRPTCNLRLTRLDAQHLGALFYFFELATAYAGELFEINAYDQPGVELSKTMLFGLLGRPGYERPDREAVCGTRVESIAIGE